MRGERNGSNYIISMFLKNFRSDENVLELDRGGGFATR